VTNPARFQAILNVDREIGRQQAQLALLQQNRELTQQAAVEQQRIEQSRAREAWAEAEDAKFDAELAKTLPQFSQGENKSDLKRAAIDTLKSVGLTDQQIADVYQRGAPIDLRSAAAQTILAKAAAYDLGQRRMREASKAPAPQVQRPGIARP